MSTLDAITGAQKYLETSAVQQLDEFKKAFRKTPPRLITMASLRAELRKFEDSVWSIMKVISQQIVLMSNSFDVIEMRHRSDFLLFQGVPETDGYEEDAVVSVCRSMMHLPEVDVDSFLLSRRLGAPIHGRTRPILVRFKDPELRDLVWEKRAALRGSSVVISEFLTRRRLEVFNRARKNFGDHNVWTYKGIIFIKVPNGETHYIVTDDQLTKLMTQHLGGQVSVKEPIGTWNSELVPQVELTSPRAEETTTLSGEVVTEETTPRVEVVPLTTNSPLDVKSEPANTASHVSYIPLDTKVMSPVPEVASYESSVTAALPSMMVPFAQYVPSSSNVAVPAQFLPPSISVVAPGQYIPISAEGIPVPYVAFSPFNAHIASQVKYVPALPSAMVAMPVQSVEPVPSNARGTSPFEFIQASSNWASPTESIPASGTIKMPLPVEATPLSVKMALPEESIPPSAGMTMPMEALTPSANIALPIESIVPREKMVLSVEPVPPSTTVESLVDSFSSSEKMSVSVVALAPNTGLAFPVEPITSDERSGLPVEDIPQSERIALPIDIHHSMVNAKEEFYVEKDFPTSTVPTIESVASTPNVASYAYFPPPPMASLDELTSPRKSANLLATSPATPEEELTSSMSSRFNAHEREVWPSRVGIRDINPMTDEQLDSLYFALTRRIAESPEGKGPIFESVYYKPGWLLIVCKNQHAKTWLYNTIPSLKPWPGSKLSLVSESDVLNPKIGIVFIPTPEAKDIGHTLCLLRAQNKGLQTDIWKVLNKRDEKDGVTLTLSLDESSVEALKQMDLKATLAFRKVHFSIMEGTTFNQSSETIYPFTPKSVTSSTTRRPHRTLTPFPSLIPGIIRAQHGRASSYNGVNNSSGVIVKQRCIDEQCRHSQTLVNIILNYTNNLI